MAEARGAIARSLTVSGADQVGVVDAIIGLLGPNARHLFTYWQGLPRRDFVPLRRDFDPMAIAAILPLITLLERVIDDNWRFRLVGTAVEQRWGGRYTGLNYLELDFVSAKAAAAMRREFVVMTEQPCGSWSRRRVEFRSGRRTSIQTLRLPLRANDGNAAQIISCSEEFGAQTEPATDGPHEIINITEQQFLDIGAGAPATGVLS